MRSPTLLSGLVFLFILSMSACAEDVATPEPTAYLTTGAISPNWILHTPDGVAVELAKVTREKPQIVLFWATWCPYCKALMPHLQSIQLEYGDAIGVLAVSIRENGNPAKFIDKAGYDFTVLPDGDAVADQYGIYGTPGLLIIDAEQIIRFDRRRLPGLKMSPDGKKLSNARAAKRLAPYWAAEIRKALDTVMSET